MVSLRRRVIVGSLIWTSATILFGAAGLFYIMDRVIQTQFDQALLDRHLQVAVALSNTGGNEDQMRFALTDPRYDKPYSGRYWQVVSEQDAAVVSRSLFDTLFPKPTELGPSTEIWEGEGPNGMVRGTRQSLMLDDGSVWSVLTAESLNTLAEQRAGLRRNMTLVFAGIGLLMLSGAAVQMSLALRPLNKLRDDVAHRWEQGQEMDPDEYPEEVSPLVSDLNAVLAKNANIMDSARRQSADLAHALKTPSAILRNTLVELEGKGFDTTISADALNRIDAQVSRSLARLRAANAAGPAVKPVSIRDAVVRLVRAISTLPSSDGKTIETHVEALHYVFVDRQDLEEILGNVLENALKWCRSKVEVGVEARDGFCVIEVSDDGPGIPDEMRAEALRAGGRLDTAMPGSGLGLSIVRDLVDIYEGKLSLDRAPRLGGLRVSVALPPRHSPSG